MGVVVVGGSRAAGSEFFKREDDEGVLHPYCETGYRNLFGKKCGGCGKVIVGEWL